MSLYFCFFIYVSASVISSVSFEEVYKRLQRRTSRPVPNTLSANFKNDTICIMTRDNICLSTTIYTPTVHIGPFSVVYEKTPYGKGNLSTDATQFIDAGYVFIAQDNRGRFDSNGSYSMWRTSGNDTMDTIQYLLSQSWFDGNIGVYGVSANAISQYVNVEGVTFFETNSNNFNKYNTDFQHILFGELIVGMNLVYEFIYQGYAYRQGLVSGWLQQIIQDEEYIKTVLQNEQFTPTYWQSIEGAYNDQWKYVNQSLIHYAGFYDIMSSDQIATAIVLNTSSQINAMGKQILVIEAGGHCQKGAVEWPNTTWGWTQAHQYAMEAYKNAFKDPNTFNIHDYFPWNVAWYQLGPGGVNKKGNYWITAKSFPSHLNEGWYLNGNNMLIHGKNQTDGSLSYIYNPKDPVMTYGGNNLILTPCGPQNQNQNEKDRTDILHFTAAKLTTNIAILGMIEAILYVSSDAMDTDFTAKLIDMYPNGEPMLIQDSIFRMRWRNHYENPYQYNPAPAMKPNEIYEIHIQIGIMSYIFNSGHQISLSISSSNYPRFSLNYNSGNMVIDGDKNWRNATNTIYYGQKYPSKLILPVVDNDWLEARKVKL